MLILVGWRNPCEFNNLMILPNRVECGNLFSSVRTGQLTKGQVWFSAPQSFHFQKIPGGPNINFYWWKLAWSFLLHKKNAEIQIWIWLLKSTNMDPQKSGFLVFEENPPTFFFSSCFRFNLALKTIEAQMFFWLIFLFVFKILIKITFVCLLF